MEGEGGPAVGNGRKASEGDGVPVWRRLAAGRAGRSKIGSVEVGVDIAAEGRKVAGDGLELRAAAVGTRDELGLPEDFPGAVADDGDGGGVVGLRHA